MLGASQSKIVQIMIAGAWHDTHFEHLEVNDVIRFLKPDRSPFPVGHMDAKIVIVKEMPHLRVDPLSGGKTILRDATNNCAAEQVTQSVVCHKPAHVYEVSGGQPINFVRKEGAEVVRGTTNEDLLNVLIHRTEILDSQMHCEENVAALEKLREALALFEKRSASRGTPAVMG